VLSVRNCEEDDAMAVLRDIYNPSCEGWVKTHFFPELIWS